MLHARTVMDLVHDIASSHDYDTVVASDYILQIQVSECRSNATWLIPLTHSLLTHSLTHSLTHLFAHSLAGSFPRSHRALPLAEEGHEIFVIVNVSV